MLLRLLSVALCFALLSLPGLPVGEGGSAWAQTTIGAGVQGGTPAPPPPPSAAAIQNAGAGSSADLASGGALLSLNLGGDDDEGAFVPALRLALLLMGLALIPAMLISVTSFARIAIVLGFLRQALGTQSLPPNQFLIGLALFLALFTMRPVLAEIDEQAIQPYRAGELNDLQALDAAVGPVRAFMARHTRAEDLALFVSMVQDTRPERFEDVDTLVLVPAFMLSELRVAFTMGALIFLPFLVIDLVVASVLMGMGMMMVPPVMVSLPIKLLLFVLADGWNLVIRSLARSVLGV